MTIDPTTTSRKPLRLWPGVIAAALIVLARLVGVFVPAAFGTDVLVAAAGAAAILVWWLFFSRAPWVERLGAIAAIVIAVVATKPFLHESINGEMIAMLFMLYALPPVLGPAFVAWAALSRRLSPGLRWVSMVASIFLACGVWTLVRTEGITGNASAQLAWRWTKTPEERLLAQAPEETAPAPPASDAPAVTPEPIAATGNRSPEPVRTTPVSAPAAEADKPPPPPPDASASRAHWPGFRGPNRDAVVHGVKIETDWSKTPPAEMWRRPIGPGLSSFAVQGDLFYTQEQRGQEEMVSGYRVSTGKPVWRHRDPVRFWELASGAGPRGTPALSTGRLYAFGATGILNALEARSGKLLWSRNVGSDTGRKVPGWGFSSSPLVIDDVVIVAAAGTLAAYHATNGNQRWIGPKKLASYSSPHRATIAGVEQVLLLSGSGALSVAPASGDVLWEHEWMPGGAAIVQPALMPEGDVLISGLATIGAGIRRLAVAHEPGGWSVSERWTSNGLKPHFNDFVVHNGHAFGFDGNILACIDLDDGKRKWKGGRYGNGQLILLADQDALLVISEDGELALVGATTDQFRELARFKAIEGKTWNHPAVVGDVLLVRNGEEMAAFRLPVAQR